MYVATLHTDDAAGWEQHELDDPSWDQIAAAIQALDNVSKTLVMLAADEDHWLGVGGGDGEGHYFVTITDGETYAVATTSNAPATTVRLVVGGQAADYPAHECVNLETALRVAQRYVVDGAQDPAVAWEYT